MQYWGDAQRAGGGLGEGKGRVIDQADDDSD